MNADVLLKNAKIQLLYIMKPQNLKIFFIKKDYKKKQKQRKNIKWAHSSKNYAHTYNAEISNFFNPGKQFKNSEFVTKNKQKKLLNRFRGFQFVIVVVLIFEKITKQNILFELTHTQKKSPQRNW